MQSKPGSRFSSLSRRRQWLIIIMIVALAAAVLAGLYMLAQHFERAALVAEEPKGNLEGRFETPLRVEYGGKTYEQKQRLTTILLMGIDKGAERSTASSGLRDGGQADFLALMIIDSQGKTVSSIHIDRDTMAEITTLGIFGNVSGSRRAQISLQHGFGDGGEQSARLTADAVSKLFGGMPVDFYIALDMDAISTLNDALGGVEVKVEDDFSALDPAMAKGSTIRLTGQQAEYFVRSRMQVGDGSNASRMIRQRQFLSAAGDLLARKLKESAAFADTLLNALEPSMRTDMRRGRLINEINAASGYERAPMQSLKGEHILAQDGFMEFFADQAALDGLVLSLFFREVE